MPHGGAGRAGSCAMADRVDQLDDARGAEQRVLAARFIGVGPAWLSTPVEADLVPASGRWPWVTMPMSMPSSSRIGPCSMCSSKKACTGRPPTGSVPAKPMRVEFVAERLALGVLDAHRRSSSVKTPANTPEAIMAGAKREPSSLVQMHDLDRMPRLDVEIVERAHDLERRHARRARRRTCRRSAGCRGGCRP